MIHLRVISNHFEPMLSECGAKQFRADLVRCRFPGWMAEAFDYIMHSLNWTYEIVELPPGEFGWSDPIIYDQADNLTGARNWTGVLHHVELGTGDVSVLMQALRGITAKSFAATYPIIKTNFAALTGRLRISTLETARIFFNVYAIDTWLSIVGVMVVLMLILRVIYRYVMPTQQRALSTVYIKHKRVRPARMTLWPLSLNITFVLWGFFELFFSHIAHCTPTQPVSRLLIPTRRGEFSNGVELIEAVRTGRATLMFGNNDSIVYEQITTLDYSLMKDFRVALETNPALIRSELTGKRDAITLISDDASKVEILSQGYAALTAKQACGLRFVDIDDLPLMPVLFTLYFRKNFPQQLLDKVNDLILTKQYQFAQIYYKYIEHAPEVRCTPEERGDPEVRLEPHLSIAHLYGLIFMLCCGAILALLMFVHERLLACFPDWVWTRAWNNGTYLDHIFGRCCAATHPNDVGSAPVQRLCCDKCGKPFADASVDNGTRS